MTKLLYFTDPSLASLVTVQSCTPYDDTCYRVALDATPFHPQGGGQLTDVGWLDDAEVLNVVMEDGDIAHYVDRPLPLGTVQAKVHASERLMNSRLHSAGHVIGHLMERMGWKTLKACHYPLEARMIFVSAEKIDIPRVDQLQHWCDQAIQQNASCHIAVDEQGYRLISFEHLGQYACSGTHVQTLSDIGQIVIRKIKMKKDELKVSYDVA